MVSTTSEPNEVNGLTEDLDAGGGWTSMSMLVKLEELVFQVHSMMSLILELAQH